MRLKTIFLNLFSEKAFEIDNPCRAARSCCFWIHTGCMVQSYTLRVLNFEFCSITNLKSNIQPKNMRGLESSRTIHIKYGMRERSSL